MSDASRETSLPAGVKELSEVFELQQQTDEALKEVAVDVAAQGQRLAPLIFARLRRTIDEDLLFSDQPELVMPDITAMTAKVFHELSPATPGSSLESWMIAIISQEVYKYIRRHARKVR